MRRFLLFPMILLTGCSLFIQKPDVSVKSITLTGVDTKGIEVSFLLAVKNPNSYRLDLTGYRYDLYVSSVELSRGENSDSTEFPANAETDVKMPLRVEFHDLLKTLKATPDPDQVPYQLIASLNMRTPLGSFTLPVDKRGTFALPRNLILDRFLKHIK